MMELFDEENAYTALADQWENYGTLNYYSAEHEQMDIKVKGDRATLRGRSCVNAAVFGGGRHTWHLQLSFELVKHDGRWQFTAASASTY